MNRIAVVALGVGVALMLAAQVQAQEASAKARNILQAQDDVPSEAVGERPQRPQRAEDPLGFYRAKDIIGMMIHAENGTPLGTVDDLVLDSRSDEVQYFLVDPTTELELESEGLLVLPFAVIEEPLRVHFVRPARFLTVGIAVDRFRTAPTITQAGFRTLRDPNFFVGIDRFYDVERPIRRGLRPGDRGDRLRDDVDRPRRRPGADDADRPRRPRTGTDDADRPRRPRTGTDDADRPRTTPRRGEADRPKPRTERGDRPQTTPRTPEKPADKPDDEAADEPEAPAEPQP